MGTNKRYGTPSEREERHRRTQEEYARELERRRPRHCWVREGDDYIPGLLVEWVPHAAEGLWNAYVVWVDPATRALVYGLRSQFELRPLPIEAETPPRPPAVESAGD